MLSVLFGKKSRSQLDFYFILLSFIGYDVGGNHRKEFDLQFNYSFEFMEKGSFKKNLLLRVLWSINLYFQIKRSTDCACSKEEIKKKEKKSLKKENPQWKIKWSYDKFQSPLCQTTVCRLNRSRVRAERKAGMLFWWCRWRSTISPSVLENSVSMSCIIPLAPCKIDNPSHQNTIHHIKHCMGYFTLQRRRNPFKERQEE